MPRFHIVLCDSAFSEVTEASIFGHIKQSDHPVDAILSHPWLTSIYRDSWIEKNLRNPTVEGTIDNIYSTLSWYCLCVNLDEAIMRNLNGGASNVSSETTQDTE